MVERGCMTRCSLKEETLGSGLLAVPACFFPIAVYPA